jgi:hypothetical protein
LLLNPTGHHLKFPILLFFHILSFFPFSHFSLQITNFRQHVLRLRELASSAKAAADAEDAVDVSGEGEAPARNQDSLRRIELVMIKSAEMDELTNRFITVSQVGTSPCRDIESV